MTSQEDQAGVARTRGRILVVDDNLDLARTIEIALGLSGHDVAVATGAEAALELLDADEAIDVMLSDIRMPDVDGYSLVRIVRHRYPEVSVLLMSAFPWSADDVIPQGVTILGKPFDLDTLAHVIDEARRETAGRRRS